MTKFSSLALGVALLGLASCATDEPGKNGPGSSTSGDVYATLTLSLPSTRSATDGPGEGVTNSNADPDYEVGLDKENAVKGIYVLLARHEAGKWSYVGSSYQDNVMASGMVDNNVTYTLSFESAELATAIAANEGESINVNVFAFCNPTVEVMTALNGLNASSDLTDFFNNGTLTLTNGGGDGIWADNSFLMTNAEISTDVVIPDYATLVETYGNAENPLNLGTVKVERVMSRFDFREFVLNDKNTGEPYEANVYPIRVGTSDEIVAFVKLNAMSLVNEAKQFYLLPRVSSNGLNDEMTLCGVETPLNYVVSPNADVKQKNKPSTLSDYYFFPLYNGTSTVSPESFTYTPFTSIKEDDNWNGPAGENYKIWRYCTENTIPGVEYQKEGITTGIYFRGEIVPSATMVLPENWTDETTQAEKLAYAMSAGQTLYFFKEDAVNVLYAGIADLFAVAKANPTSKLHDAVEAAWGVDLEDETLDIGSLNALRQTSEGIGMYRPTTGNKYFVYYFYKNRHNDNGKNTDMGRMEFATVRNNVYKLYVSNIHQFGHPGSTPDDPDPEDPDDPDETENVYFNVHVQVLPWVVRVNNIEF